MSFTKDSTNNTVIFHYPTEDLFNRVNALTLYAARAIKNQQGESMIDEYALTADERSAFDIFMRRAATKVFMMVKKMTNSVTGALTLDGAVTFGDASDSDQTDQYAFTIEDNEAYNENTIIPVDEGIKDMLTYLTMADWWEICQLPDRAGYELAKYNNLKTEMENKRLFDLRKPLLSI